MHSFAMHILYERRTLFARNLPLETSADSYLLTYSYLRIVTTFSVLLLFPLLITFFMPVFLFYFIQHG